MVTISHYMLIISYIYFNANYMRIRQLCPPVSYVVFYAYRK